MNILIVDDNQFQRKVIEQLSKLKCSTMMAEGGRQAIETINNENNIIDLVLLDISMPDMNGIEVLKTIRTYRPNLPVIMVTAHNDVSLAVESVKCGAIDYITKDLLHERIKIAIENALKLNILGDEVIRLRRQVNGQALLNDIIGESKSLNEAKIIAKFAAGKADMPVFIEGERGVGKKLFAKAIHGSGPRAEKPFISLNCSEVEAEKIERVLFGDEKNINIGGYHYIGKIKEADGGTIFIDEIDKLRPELQFRLMRVISDGELSKAGQISGNINVRVIAGSNLDLNSEVRTGFFSKELYQKIKSLPITLPPLRKRREDINPLVSNFCKKFSAIEGKNIEGITDGAMRALNNYFWPGNVRELQNALFRAIAICDGDYIDLCDFSQRIPHQSMNDNPDNAPPIRFNNKLLIDNGEGKLKKLSEIEGEVIRMSLENYNWHISEVARRLGIGRSTLYRKMDEMGLKSKRMQMDDTKVA